MKYGKLECKNGVAVEVDVLEVDQTKLTSDCWSIQIQGAKACETCELKDSPDCGGQALRASGKFNKGGIGQPA